MEDKKFAVWVSDRDATHCTDCQVEFSVILRKHHCRNCGKVFCDDCTSLRLPLSVGEAVRICYKCYVEITQESFIPKQIGEFIDVLQSKKDLTNSPPVEIHKDSSKKKLRIVSDLPGHPALQITGKVTVSVQRCAIETPFDILPFPIWEGSTKDPNANGNLTDPKKDKERKLAKSKDKTLPTPSSVNPSWITYRRELMGRGRSVVVESASNTIEFVNCFITGRVAACILDAKTVVFRGCIFKGEAAVEVKNASIVKLENCVLLALHNCKKYPEDIYLTPWGVADTRSELTELKSLFRPRCGPCFSGGCALYACDNSSVQLNDCLLMGYIGVYATQQAKVTMKGCTIRAARSAFDIWDEAVVNTSNVPHIGQVRLQTETAKYFVDKGAFVVDPDVYQKDWVSDKNVSNCSRCQRSFSVSLRKHHCRSCGGVYCDACTSERAYLPKIGLLELTRICISCSEAIMVPPVLPTLYPIRENVETPHVRPSLSSSPSMVKLIESSNLQEPQIEELDHLPSTSGDYTPFSETFANENFGYKILIPKEFEKVPPVGTNGSRWVYNIDNHVFTVLVYSVSTAGISKDKIKDPSKKIQLYRKTQKYIEPNFGKLDVLKHDSNDIERQVPTILLRQATSSQGKPKGDHDTHAWTIDVFYQETDELSLNVFASVQSDYKAFKEGKCQKTFRRILESFRIYELPEDRSSKSNGNLPNEEHLVEYEEEENCFKIKIPANAIVSKKEESVTLWKLPDSDFNLGVGAAPMDPAEGIDQMVSRLKLMQENRNNIEDLIPVSIPCGSEQCVGFIVKENNLIKGADSIKEDDDKHQWQMYVVGNYRIYTVQFKLLFGELKKYEPLMIDILQSFQPIPE